MDQIDASAKLVVAEKQRGALAAEVLRLRGELQQVASQLALLQQQRRVPADDPRSPQGAPSSETSWQARAQSAEREAASLKTQLVAAREELSAAHGALSASSKQLAEFDATVARLRNEIVALEAKQQQDAGVSSPSAGSPDPRGRAQLLASALARATAAEAEASRLSAALVSTTAKHAAEVERLRATAEAAALVAQDARAVQLFGGQSPQSSDAVRLAERRRMVESAQVTSAAPEEMPADLHVPRPVPGALAPLPAAVPEVADMTSLQAEAQAEAAITRREALLREADDAGYTRMTGASHDAATDPDDVTLTALTGGVQNCLGRGGSQAPDEYMEQFGNWKAGGVLDAASAIEKALQGGNHVAVPPAARAAVTKLVAAMRDLPRQLGLPAAGSGDPFAPISTVRPPHAVARLLADNVSGLVLDCMHALKDHALAAVAGCALLAALASMLDEDTRIRMVFSGAANACVAACVAHRRDVAVQQHGCRALERLTLGSSHLQAKAVAVGAYDAAVMAIRLHGLNNASVAVAAARAVAVLAQDGQSTLAGISPGNGVRCLLTALQHHSNSHPTVAAACCRGIASLLFDDASRVAAGGLDLASAVTSAMRAHPGMPDLQAAAGAVLAQLALSPDTATAILDAGAPRALVVALRVHGPSSWEVSRGTCEAMGNIAAHAPSRQQLLASDVVPALVAALSAHPKEPDCARAAAWALQSSLRDGGPATDAALSAGALPALVAALRRHVSVARAAGRCAAAVPVLSDGPQRRLQALKAGAVPALSAVLPAAGANDERSAETALTGLTALASGPLDAKEASDALLAVLSCMATPLGRGSYAIQRRGCTTVARLAAVARTACAVHGASACERVLAARRSFPADLHMSQLACLAIAALATAQDGVNVTPMTGMNDLHSAALRVLRVHGSHGGACAQACAAIASTPPPPTTPADATWLAVTQTMRAHSRDAHVLEAGLNAIAALSQHNHSSDASAQLSSTPALVVSALRTCGQSPSLVVAGCAAMIALAKCSPQLADGCIMAGALDAVATTLTSHAARPECCSATLQALHGVLGAAGGGQVRVLPPSLPSAAVAARAAHAQVASVAEAACALLATMAAADPTGQGVRGACVAAGAITCATAALGSHPSHGSVVNAAAQALLALYKPPAVGGSGTGAPAAAEALVAALVTHGSSSPDTGALLSTALAVVTAQSLDAKARAGAAGGIEAAVAVLGSHPTDSAVARGALAVLHSCAINVEAWARAGTAGATPAVVKALKEATSRDAAAAALAARAVRSLAISEKAVVQLVNAGAPAVLVTALRQLSASTGVCEHAADAIVCLAKQAQGKAACLTANAPSALAQVQAACASDGRAAERVSAALAALGATGAMPAASAAAQRTRMPQSPAPAPSAAAAPPTTPSPRTAVPPAAPALRGITGDARSVLAALGHEQATPDARQAEQLCLALAASLSGAPAEAAPGGIASAWVSALAAAALRHPRAPGVAAAVVRALGSLPPSLVAAHPPALEALLTIIQVACAHPRAPGVVHQAASCLAACTGGGMPTAPSTVARRAACVLLSALVEDAAEDACSSELRVMVDTSVCRALASLCGVQPQHTGGAVGAALGAMHVYRAHADVAQHAAGVLASRLVADDPPTGASAAALEAVCEALAAYGSASPDAGAQLCAALIPLLAASTVNRNRASALGTLESVAATLRVGHALAPCAAAACGAMAHLVLDAEARRQAADAGAIDAAAAALRSHGLSAEVVAPVCRCLTALTSSHPGNKARAVSARVHEMATAALKAHAGHAGAAAAACGLLGSLAVSPEHTTKVAQAGAVAAIVGAMRGNAQAPDVQAQAASALGVLAVSPANQTLVGSLGGVDALVSALRLHSAGNSAVASVGVLTHCTGALGVCVADPGNAAIALRCGAVEALVAALAGRAGSVALLQQGCATLGILAAAPDATGEQARAALAAVMAAAQAHADSPAVLDEALGALAACVTHPKALDAAARSEACVTVVVQALRMHGSHERVQAQALCALGCLVVHPTLEAQAVTAGALPLVVTVAHGAGARSASGRGRGSAAVQHACGCLAAFASGQQGDARVVAAGGIDAVLNAMECCPTAAGVAEEALLAIAKLCRDPQRRGPVVAAGAVEAAVAAVRQHETVEGVQEAGLKALSVMVAGVPANAQRAAAAGAMQAAQAATANFGDVSSVADAANALMRELV